MTDETKKAIKAFEAVRDDAENPILTIHELKFFAVAEPACKEALSALCDRIARQNPQPLTLEELRGMGGEPVYIKYHTCGRWEIYQGFMHDHGLYGKTWLAYRRKSESCNGIDLASGPDSTVCCSKPEADNGE